MAFSGINIGWVLVAATHIIIAQIFSTIFVTFRYFEGVNQEIYRAVSFGYIGFTVLAVWSHLVCIFKDPGIMTEDIPNKDQFKVCERCFKPKNQQVHHCSRCKVCIYKMDHHCHWVNNCVGYFNQKVYILFLIYIALFSTTSIALIAFSKIYCNINPQLEYCKYYDTNYFIEFSKLLALALSLFFAVFVVFLLSEQYESISTSVSQIDRLKNVQAQSQGSFKRNLQDVFQHQSVLLWALPICKTTAFSNIFPNKSF